MQDRGVIGAVAEDADSVFDPEFQPTFSMIDAMHEAIRGTRQAIQTERLLYRGQRPMRPMEGVNVVVVDGHVTSPWKVLAAARAAQEFLPTQVVIGIPVSTQDVQERIRAQRLQFVCPSIVMDQAGHPHPFGDQQDASSIRLRSLVLARDAA